MANNNSLAVPGWTLLVFLASAALLAVPAVWLARDFGMLGALAAFFGAGLAAIAIAVAPLGMPVVPALGFQAVGWKPIVLGVVVTTLISVAVSQLGVEPQGMKQAVEIASRPDEFLISLAILAGLAPVVEELTFRGLLYGWLAGRWGPVAAWIVSSLAFAAAHVELAHAVLVLPLGLWFGWLRWRTGSLWPSLVAHIANNGLAVSAAALLAD
ncbi:MAG: CPBP family intramembrane glutamic endopeptidase [Pseudomonadota bacterium]